MGGADDSTLAESVQRLVLINLGLRDVRKRHRTRDASHLVMSEGRRMQLNDVRGGVVVGCSHLLCEGRRTQVDVRTYVFQTRVVF